MNGRMRMKSAAILLLCIACGKNESSSAVDLVKTIATESRTRPRVEVSVKLNGEQPAPDEIVLQKTIEDRIEQAQIGRLVSSGTNAGFINVTVEVANSADGIAKLRSILQTSGVLNRSSFKVTS